MISIRKKRIRAGAIMLVASAVLTVVGLLLRGPVIDVMADANAYALGAVSSRHVPAWTLLLPNLVLQLGAFMALFAYMEGGRADRWAFIGMVLSIAGNGLFLPSTGVIAFVSPTIGRMFLAGNPVVVEIANAGLAGALALPILAGSGLLLFLGSVFFGVAIWRSRTLPKLSSIPYVLHTLLITFAAAVSYGMELVGAGLYLWSALWLFGALWRGTALATEPEAPAPVAVTPVVPAAPGAEPAIETAAQPG